MIKKAISLIMVLAITLGMTSNVLAATEQKQRKEMLLDSNRNSVTTEEIIYVDDGNGNIIPVTIIETTCFAVGNGGATQFDLSPQYTVGSTKTYTIKISNAQLGIPSGIVTLTSAMKKAAADIAANAITTKLGAHFIPGLNLAAAILSFIALINAACGNSGIKVIVNLKYKETYLHKEGYYIYGWDVTSASLGTY